MPLKFVYILKGIFCVQICAARCHAHMEGRRMGNEPNRPAGQYINRKNFRKLGKIKKK